MKLITQVAGLIAAVETANACSNILLTRDSTTDASNMVAYNADSANLFGSLYHYKHADHEKGEMRQIYDWDTAVYLGEIPEPPTTYNVIGNTNEHGVIIGETTFGGLADLQEQDGAIIDYGSLIWVTLQRSKTAVEAINTIGQLLNDYGYASEGESFSIADQNSVWVMEIIGKGNYEKGAVWVARKIPDGYVCAHANQARITTFPMNDPENCIYAPDVVTFAQKIGAFPKDGDHDKFDFSDVYDPVTFSGARFCEARVWTFFSGVMGDEFAEQYWDYAAGYNLTNRMPLWVKPAKKVSLSDTFEYMRNHYENSWFDMTAGDHPDVGAEDAGMPMRARPLTWTASNGKEYLNERAIGTPQTGWNFVAQSRSWMPDPMAALLWFGVDDSSTTVRFPIHGGATQVPQAFAGASTQDGQVQPLLTFNMDQAFTVFNLVANFAYARWNVIFPDVSAEIKKHETEFQTQIAAVEEQAQTLWNQGGSDAHANAINFVTEYSVNTGNNLVKQWGAFFGKLFMTYRDGYKITPDVNDPICNCAVLPVEYPQQWYDRIAEGTGSRLLVPPDDSVSSSSHGVSSAATGKHSSRHHSKKTKPKTELRAMQ
jgi:dipeptidase